MADEMELPFAGRQDRLSQRYLRGHGEWARAWPGIGLAIAVEVRRQQMAVGAEHLVQAAPLIARGRSGVQQKDGFTGPRFEVRNSRAVEINVWHCCCES